MSDPRALDRSQSNPLNAVAEIVENSIDASAKAIIITRDKKEGRHLLHELGGVSPALGKIYAELYVNAHSPSNAWYPHQVAGDPSSAKRGSVFIPWMIVIHGMNDQAPLASETLARLR